jgi:hypothetical protein
MTAKAESTKLCLGFPHELGLLQKPSPVGCDDLRARLGGTYPERVAPRGVPVPTDVHVKGLSGVDVYDKRTAGGPQRGTHFPSRALRAKRLLGCFF